jgi:hypothetical protein
MTATGETQSMGNLLDCQIWLIYQQATRHFETPLQDVGMWWTARTLAERALEVTSTRTGKGRQLAQFDLLSECIFNMLDDQLERAT